MKEDEDLVFEPLQVTVRNFESAMKKFKSMVQLDGVLALYKEKQTYEKPSEKKRRKRREAIQRRLEDEMREELIASGEWDKRQKKKEMKKLKKIQERQGKNSEVVNG